MIFDCDTHMSPYVNHDRAINASGLNDMLQEAGIDRALTWLMPQGVSDVAESNKYIYDQSKIFPIFYPFGWANVMEGLDKAIEDAKRCLLDYGFRGVKLNGAQNDYPIDSPDAMKVCEVIAKNNGLIAFHIGADAPDNTGAFRAANVAAAFPETTILMVHMGGAGRPNPDRSAEVIAEAIKHPNMILIGSEIGIDKIKIAIDTLGTNRVMYGSDTPFSQTKPALANYEELLKDYDQETKDAIMFKNALRVFGLN